MSCILLLRDAAVCTNWEGGSNYRVPLHRWIMSHPLLRFGMLLLIVIVRPRRPLRRIPCTCLTRNSSWGVLMSCKGRREFLAELEARLGHFNDTIAPPLLELPTPDRYFEELDKIAIEVGCNHHGRQNRFNAFDSC